MAELASAGCKLIALDVTDDASMVAAVDQIIREKGRIDVLINNAGYGQFGALEDVPMDAGRRQLETNLIGPARLIQLCLPHMRAQRYGRIFNISSIGGKLATPLGGWYHASKYGLEGYSDALRNEVSRFGIDVVVIEPGGIETEWSGIASDEAERYSGQGAYADYVAKFRQRQAQLGKSPPPQVITDLIVKALKAKRPATRYHGGLLAGPLLFLRRVLSDRMMDWLILSAFR
jgi:NAD(P)-dependent dehydrogenase (short-subunit alcohol dehydrogenase family)